MDKMLWARQYLLLFDWIFFSLAGNDESHKVLDEFDFGKIGRNAFELLALVRQKRFP